MSWLSKLLGKRTAKKLKLPSKLNSLDDLLERPGDLAELIELAQIAVKNPNTATLRLLGEKLKELGL